MNVSAPFIRRPIATSLVMQQHDCGHRRDSRSVATFQAQLPPSVHLTIRGDRSTNIRRAFADIQWTMLLTLALASR